MICTENKQDFTLPESNPIGGQQLRFAAGRADVPRMGNFSNRQQSCRLLQ
jgi:hypothetical protein